MRRVRRVGSVPEDDPHVLSGPPLTPRSQLPVSASVVLGIEVSTVRENIVSQPGIGEQTVALEYIEKDLGDDFEFARLEGPQGLVDVGSAPRHALQAYVQGSPCKFS